VQETETGDKEETLAPTMKGQRLIVPDVTPGQDLADLQVEPDMLDKRYALRKRKMPMDEEERTSKMAKTMIALIDLLEDDTELALLAAKHDLEIPIPRTYDEAVNDPNYS